MKDFFFVLFFSLFFYLLFLIKSTYSFYSNFSYLILYIILFSLFLIIIFENPKSKKSIILAGLVGLFWDFFSLKPAGFYFIILIIIALIIKTGLKNYVRPLSK